MQEVYCILQKTDQEKTDQVQPNSLVKKILSSHQVQVFQNKKHKWTLLHTTTKNLSTRQIKLLLECGHSPNIVGKKNDSSLSIAVQTQDLEKVQAIFPHCTKQILSLENSKGHTPFHIAIKKSEAITRYFLESCSDILDLVPESKLYNTLKLLIQHRSTKINQLALSRCSTLSSLKGCEGTNEWGQTLLFWAQKYHNTGLTAQLQKAQIDKPFIMSIEYQNFTRLLSLFAPRHFHHFNLNKIKKKGSFTQCTVPVLKHYWDTYVSEILSGSQYIKKKQLPQLEFYSKISNALHDAALEIDATLLFINYHNNLPIIILTGWSGHSVAITLYKDILTISNRGNAAYNQKSKLEVYKITQACVTNTLIQEIYKCNNASREVSSKFLYKTLLEALKAQQTKFCLSIQNQLQLSDQKHPNCAVASPKLSIFGLLLSEFQHMKTLSEEQYTILHNCYKDFSQYTRVSMGNLMSEHIENKLSFFFEAKLQL